MVEHHIQKKIIADLVECEHARYSQLKPNNIDGNVFTYHLQSLIKMKLIEKTSEGMYQLTSNGKLYGINGSLNKTDVLKQAHSIILLSVRSDENVWLLRQRLVQPLFGKTGFIHGEPKAGESITESAERILLTRTNLSGNHSVKGMGFITINSGGDQVSYTNFTLVEVTNLSGELKELDNHGKNTWVSSPDFSSKDMIPSMADLVPHIVKPGIFFIDVSYEI